MGTVGRWRAPRRRPLPSRCAGARERRGAACADFLPADSSPFPVKDCSSGRESGSLRLPGLGSGWQWVGEWGAGGRRDVDLRVPCGAGARERRGAACADLLPDTFPPFPVNGCRSGREPGSLRLPGGQWLAVGPQPSPAPQTTRPWAAAAASAAFEPPKPRTRVPLEDEGRGRAAPLTSWRWGGVRAFDGGGVIQRTPRN